MSKIVKTIEGTEVRLVKHPDGMSGVSCSGCYFSHGVNCKTKDNTCLDHPQYVWKENKSFMGFLKNLFSWK